MGLKRSGLDWLKAEAFIEFVPGNFVKTEYLIILIQNVLEVKFYECRLIYIGRQVHQPSTYPRICFHFFRRQNGIGNIFPEEQAKRIIREAKTTRILISTLYKHSHWLYPAWIIIPLPAL
jgi:hypothetical protein